MRVKLNQFGAIATLTALETIRQPLALLLTLSCVVAMGLAPLLLMHQFGEHGKLVRDGALALHFVCGLFFAGSAASSTVWRELRRGTAATVLSKPVGPELFLLAKFCGIAAAVMAFSLGAGIAGLLSERAAPRGFEPGLLSGLLLLGAPAAACALGGLRAYATRGSFASAAFGALVALLVVGLAIVCILDERGARVPFGSQVQWRMVPAGALITLALLVLAAVAVTLATRLSPAPTICACAVLLILGLVSEHLFAGPAARLPALGVVRALVPDWQHFWLADALTGGGVIPWPYVGRAAAYALLYLAGILCLGMLSLRHAETR